MDVDEVFLGPSHKIVKKNLTKFNDENDEKCVKCKFEEVNELLSLKKLQLQQPRYERNMALSEAEWDDDLKLAKVVKTAKNLTKNFCHSRNKSMYLYPEECLCLMEMKCLVLTWKERKLSIKNAFTLLLNSGSGCTFEQFRTYGYLVKLGFRVFRHDEKIKSTDDLSPKDLTKQPSQVKKANKKKCTGNKQIKNSQDSNNKAAIPNANYLGWVIISRPPLHLMPYNLQPNYDSYSFNIVIKPDGQTNITEVLCSNKSNNSSIQNTFSKAQLLHNSQTIGLYPIYEKNIPGIKVPVNYQNKDINYVPPAKKSKLTKTEYVSIPVLTNATVCALDSKNNLNASNNKTNSFTKVLDNISNVENYEIEGGNLTSPHNVTVLTSRDTCNIYASNKETETKNLLDENNQQNDEEIVDNLALNFNNTEENHSNSKFKKHTTNTNLEEYENNVFDKHINIPSRIREKLFAVKPKTIQDKLTDDHDNEHRVHYDVYYPDNSVAKTTRSAPNFRVIVFEDGDTGTFPNVYKVTVSTPNDNVPMLWAIVNSSQVSFYNVNSIVLPKSSEWEIKGNKAQNK